MAIRNFFTDGIYILPIQKGDYNEVEFLTRSPVMGRFESLDELRASSQGQEAVAKARIFFPADTEITTEDWVKFNGTKYKVYSITQPAGRRATKHLEVLVK